jgi:hypothetical protein
VCQLAGLIPATFTDDPLVGVVIKAVHITEPRSALDAALSALGFSTGGYTDTTLTGTPIKAVHINELRSRTQ